MKNYINYFDFEYLGFCKYNAFLDFKIHDSVNEPFKPIFINDFEQYFKDYTDENIYKKIKDFDLVVSAKVKNIIDTNSKYIVTLSKILGESAIKNISEQNEIYTDMAFLMKTDLLKKYLEWLFNVLFGLENKISFENIEENAFENLSNILFNVWLGSKQNLKIKETTSVSIPMGGM